jgi:hypothetical protein
MKANKDVGNNSLTILNGIRIGNVQDEKNIMDLHY